MTDPIFQEFARYAMGIALVLALILLLSECTGTREDDECL